MPQIPFAELLAADRDDDAIRALPSLDVFAPARLAGLSGTCDDIRKHVESLCRAVSIVSSKWGYNPLIMEFAYFSDPIIRRGLEIHLRSFIATTEDQREFAFPQDDGRATPYVIAIEKMNAVGPRDRPERPEPIGGHPNLWQNWKNTPRVGFVHFPAQSVRTQEGYCLTECPGAIPTAHTLHVSPIHDSTLPLGQYDASVEDTFHRFVSEFIIQARNYRDAFGEKLGGAFNRLLRSEFLGVPFVRHSAEIDSATAAELEALGLAQARGAIFLLFLERATYPSRSPAELSAGLQEEAPIRDLGRALYALLAEMGLREAAQRTKKQVQLMSYMADLIHNTGNMVRSINPDSIAGKFGAQEIGALKNPDAWRLTLVKADDHQRSRTHEEALCETLGLSSSGILLTELC